MTTSLDTIKRSLRMLGVYSTGEDPSAEESQEALAALNGMLALMSGTGLVYVKSLDTISLTANDTSITVGPSGETVTGRPVQVLGESYIDLGGVSYPLQVLTLDQYNAASVKATTGIPVGIWPQMDMPDITLTFWPVPSEAMTLNLWSNKVLTGDLDLTTILAFPPGYDDLLAYLLAESLAPEYEVEVPAAVMRGAGRARRIIKRLNFQVPLQRLPVEVCGPYYANWRSG